SPSAIQHRRDPEDPPSLLSRQKKAHSHLQDSTLLSWEQEVQNRSHRGHVRASTTLRHRDRVPHGGTGCRTKQRRTTGLRGLRYRNTNNIASSRPCKSNRNRQGPLGQSSCGNPVQQHGSNRQRPNFWNTSRSSASSGRRPK